MGVTYFSTLKSDVAWFLMQYMKVFQTISILWNPMSTRPLNVVDYRSKGSRSVEV
jgi:hypothetical protein